MVNMYFAVFACKVTKKVLNTSKKGEKKQNGQCSMVNVQCSMVNVQWSMFNGLLRVTFTFQFVSLAKKRAATDILIRAAAHISFTITNEVYLQNTNY